MAKKKTSGKKNDKKYGQPNSFIMYRNYKKYTPTQPDITGTLVDENGKEFRISGWVRVDAQGRMTSVSGKLTSYTEMKHFSMKKKVQFEIEPTEIQEPGKKRKKAKPVKRPDFGDRYDLSDEKGKVDGMPDFD